MHLRDLLSDPDFPNRSRSVNRADSRFEALGRLAHAFSEAPEVLLQRLVDIAVEFCNADSAGLSLEEHGEDGNRRFRWIAIAGSFAKYLHGTTPRFFSPCGTCLDRNSPQLYRVTQPYYDFLGVQADPITDGILIPWRTEGVRGTLWVVSHHSAEAFDMEDYRLLHSLSDFAAIAVRHQRQDEALREQERLETAAATAHELAHHINNPLQSLTNMLYLAQMHTDEMPNYLEQASLKLAELSQIIHDLLLVHKAKPARALTEQINLPAIAEGSRSQLLH